MEENLYLKSAILEVIDNQLQANDPPETRQTFDRLISEKYSEEEAKELIGCVVTSEIFDVLKKRNHLIPKDLQRRSMSFQSFPKIEMICNC